MNSFKKSRMNIQANPKNSLEDIRKRGKAHGVGSVTLLLKNKDAQIRNAAALILREMRNDKAVEPLMKAIKNSRDRNNIGTLVYALEVLDCSKWLLALIDLVLHGNYEVQNHALAIIAKQSFKAGPKDICKARGMIRKYSKLPNKCEDYQLLIANLEKYLLRIEQETSQII